MEGESILKEGAQNISISFLFMAVMQEKKICKKACSFGVNASSLAGYERLDARFYLAHWLGAWLTPSLLMILSESLGKW